MKTVLFTKLFGRRAVDEIGETALELGFDGIDLLIREGFSASPDDPASISRNATSLAGLGVPVVTATCDLTDPRVFPADTVLGRCSDAGIPTLRVGYWFYDGTVPYRDVLATAQRDLDALEHLAGRHGVTLLVQLHGGTIHASGALASRLFEGRDPKAVGSYIDPGNQAVQDGREDWRLTFDLIGDRLHCVGVKNGAWSAGGLAPSGQRRWSSDWCGVPDGYVPWDAIIEYLTSTGFSGVLSFHGHYALPYAQVVDQTRTDLRFIRRLMGTKA